MRERWVDGVPGRKKSVFREELLLAPPERLGGVNEEELAFWESTIGNLPLLSENEIWVHETPIQAERELARREANRMAVLRNN